MRRRYTKRIVKYRELRLKCTAYDKNIMWNAKKVWKECDEENRCDLGISNNNDEQEVNDKCDSESDKLIKNNERIKRIVDKIKVKGKVEDEKEEGVVRLFSAICNGFGPYS